MPISSTLSARLGTGPAPTQARWNPYGRPSVSESRGGASARASRRPLRLDPATTRLFGPAQEATPSGSGRCDEPAASDAAAAPARRRRGCEMTKPKLRPAEGDEKPPLEEKNRSGGGFVFHCALAGHTEAISGISLPLCSDKLYSGSVDGSVRVWDCNSGKAWNTQTRMKRSLQGPSGLVCSMTINNEMLFAGTGDGCIMAWKFPSKETSTEPVAILGGHEASGSSAVLQRILTRP